MTKYKPKMIDFSREDICAQFDRNWDMLKAIDKQAADKGELVGRYITEPYADGQAVYQIIGKSFRKGMVKIRVCTQLGDDWVIPYWGNETYIEEAYARARIAE